MMITLLLALMIVANHIPNADQTLQSFTTIQEAINSANEGDTIHVPPDTYFEHVTINKTLTLLGEDNNTTIIDGNNTGTTITVAADNVTITGFKLQNSGYGWTRQGVYVHHADNCTIKGNNLYNICHNIRLNHSRNSQVLENTINGPSDGVTMYGIRIENSLNCTVTQNTVSVRVGAVHLENATDCIVRGNHLTKSDQGIRLYSPCTRNQIIENTVRDNQYDGMIAIMPSDTSFTDNLIFHNNFINNTNPFVVQSTGTLWDNGLEGNYWSRHNGSDLNKDGIADTPYISERGNDNKPLMGQYLTVKAHDDIYISIVSDSTIENLTYTAHNPSITMHVSNATTDQATGFCRIKIPHALMNETYDITVDGTTPVYVNYSLHDDGYNRWIYFTYRLSQHEVSIIPEFPSSLPYTILLIALLMYGCRFINAKKRQN